MDVARYAKRSVHGVQRWREADAMLERESFTEEERETIHNASFKNRQDPVRFAQAAIRLRRHVGAGLPLS